MQRVLSSMLRGSASGVQRVAVRAFAADSPETQEHIAKLVKAHPVVLFMKGTPQQPMCGFSQLAAKDNDLREGIKIFSDWPTIPQLYVKKQFVGGADIMKQMVQDGSIEQLWKDNKIQFKPWPNQ